jgi:hypothetical protein
MEEELDLPDCHEGPDAFERFDAMISNLLEVPKSLILRRQRAYRKKVDANPNRRGPKRRIEQEQAGAPNTDALSEEA